MAGAAEACGLLLCRRAPPDGVTDDLLVSGSKVTVLSKIEPSSETFEFPEVLGPDASAEAVCTEALDRLVPAMWQGMNCLLIVLGHGRSGKTELVHGGGADGSVPTVGLAEACIRELFSQVALSPGVQIGMRFLNITDEKVQDLLQPDCHHHNLRLEEVASSGVEVVGAPLRPVLSMNTAVQTYEQGKGELSRLARFHGMDTTTASNVLTLSLKLPPTSDARSTGALRPTGSSESFTSLTVVELPAIEALVRSADARAELMWSRGPSARGGLLHFAEVVEALASRKGAQHVPR